MTNLGNPFRGHVSFPDTRSGTPRPHGRPRMIDAGMPDAGVTAGEAPLPVGTLVRGALEKTLEYQSFTAETEDNEDHTFCGIFFDLRANGKYPLSYLEIGSLWVRGQLGPITVWTKEGGHGGRHGTAVADQTQWEKVYEKTHDPSFATLVELKLLNPIKIMSGETLGVYVHSTLPGDQSIVYDNQRQYYADAVNHEACRDDGKLVILPGTAHLSNEPFGKRAPWGGDALRQGRLFVGRVDYGARWMLWNPNTHDRFPMGFRAAVEAMMMGGKRNDCLLYHLGDEIIFYVMNRCSWDWFGTRMSPNEDQVEETKRNERKELQRRKEREIAEMFGVPVDQAAQLLQQMDPYMLQHIHQQLAAGNQIVLHESSDDDESESGDESFDEADEDGESGSESDEEGDDSVEEDAIDAFADAADEMFENAEGDDMEADEEDMEADEEDETEA